MRRRRKDLLVDRVNRTSSELPWFPAPSRRQAAGMPMKGRSDWRARHKPLTVNPTSRFREKECPTQKQDGCLSAAFLVAIAEQTKHSLRHP